MRKNIIISLALLILFGQIGYAAFEETESSPRAEGMSESVTAIVSNPLEAIYNPGGLTNIDNIEVVSYYRKPYGLFQSAGAGFAIPSKIGVSALNLRWFSVQGDYRNGDSILIEADAELHREATVSLSHGVALQDNFSIGSTVHVYNLKQARFGSTYALGFDLGVAGTLYDYWKVGISLHNINSPSLGKENPEELPRVLRAGFAFSPTSSINSSFEIRHEVGFPLRFSTGHEFTVSRYLTFRTGVQTEPVRFSAGLSINFNPFILNYAVVQHAVLPWTHQISVGYILR
ncbi:MAG: hypothetical protein APR63_09085 [Desulfuromonas sp. SDB]|nr:MAG: hypothetical protein APR63_09085 [Desulfuromonas sp. SDB]